MIDRGRVGGSGGGNAPSVSDKQAEDGFQDVLGRSLNAPLGPASTVQQRAKAPPQQQQQRSPGPREQAKPQQGSPVAQRSPLAKAPAKPASAYQAPAPAPLLKPTSQPSSQPSSDEGAGRFSGLGDRLVDLRKTLGITQVELARRMGSTQPAMARIEKGEMKPNLRTLARYGEAIGQRVEVDFQPQPGNALMDEGSLGKVAIDGVPEALGQIRRKLGMTQSQVAASMETSQPVIARLENGEAVPNLRTLERYCDAVLVDPVITFEALDPATSTDADT